MLIALLSALAEDPSRPGCKLALRSFAGRSLLSHQIDCAYMLGCEQVFCMIDALNPGIIACQHRAERAGMRFQAIETVRHLTGAVTANDRVIAIADGFDPDPALAAEVLEDRSAIVTFPAEAAVPRGFERIDADRAWAGIMSVRGGAIARLSDLPEDADAVSSLLRIALQTGVRRLPLDPAALDGVGWIAPLDFATREAGEARWMARRADPAPFTALGRAIADRVGIRLSRDLIGSRFERAPFVVAFVLGIFAALLGILGKPLTGLLISGAMVFCIPIAQTGARLVRVPGAERGGTDGLWALAADGLLLALLCLAGRATQTWIDLFLPLVLLAILRIGARLRPDRYRSLAADRIALLSVLIPAGYLGFLQPAMAVIVLLALAQLFRAVPAHRLTPP